MAGEKEGAYQLAIGAVSGATKSKLTSPRSIPKMGGDRGKVDTQEEWEAVSQLKAKDADAIYRKSGFRKLTYQFVLKDYNDAPLRGCVVFVVMSGVTGAQLTYRVEEGKTTGGGIYLLPSAWTPPLFNLKVWAVPMVGTGRAAQGLDAEGSVLVKLDPRQNAEAVQVQAHERSDMAEESEEREGTAHRTKTQSQSGSIEVEGGVDFGVTSAGGKVSTTDTTGGEYGESGRLKKGESRQRRGPSGILMFDLISAPLRVVK